MTGFYKICEKRERGGRGREMDAGREDIGLYRIYVSNRPILDCY